MGQKNSVGAVSGGAASAERLPPIQSGESGDSLNWFLQRMAERIEEAGQDELAGRVMSDGAGMRVEDLDLDSLELLDLMMGLEEDFKVDLAIENLTNHMSLGDVLSEIQRCQREQGGRGAGIA